MRFSSPGQRVTLPVTLRLLRCSNSPDLKKTSQYLFLGRLARGVACLRHPAIVSMVVIVVVVMVVAVSTRPSLRDGKYQMLQMRPHGCWYSALIKVITASFCPYSLPCLGAATRMNSVRGC